MTLEEHKKLLDDILTNTPEDNRASMSGFLLTLETDYRQTQAEALNMDSRIKALEQQNKDYAEVNTRLFLERQNPVGNQSDDSHNNESDTVDTGGDNAETPPAKLNYDDLVI